MKTFVVTDSSLHRMLARQRFPDDQTLCAPAPLWMLDIVTACKASVERVAKTSKICHPTLFVSLLTPLEKR